MMIASVGARSRQARVRPGPEAASPDDPQAQASRFPAGMKWAVACRAAAHLLSVQDPLDHGCLSAEGREVIGLGEPGSVAQPTG